ncbi:hypothetical protein BPA01_25910 [Brevibacillus parabrevis]|uniref:Uncharacterized protein n=1 Tax=Brevibacillus parabrevis TaxID=54914 RepID=A0A4Y3PRP4_BREPA|nr:hypothetical protein BPA01_25910 [Brevibacillus parabrevis]
METTNKECLGTYKVADWARVYASGKKVARWKSKTSEWFVANATGERRRVPDPGAILFACLFCVAVETPVRLDFGRESEHLLLRKSG